MEPVQQKSMLLWMFESLGPFYALVLPLTGLAVFIGGCLVVFLSRRNSVVAAYLAVLPLPLLVGFLGSIQGMISGFQVIAQSGSTPKASELAHGISTALFSTLLGLLATFPSFFVVVGGLLVRTMLAREKPTDAK